MIEINTNMKVILWNFEPSRENGRKPKNGFENFADVGLLVPGTAEKYIEKNVRVGDIIYFLEGCSGLVESLPSIIDTLHRMGFELLTISDMISFPDDKPH